MYFFIDVSNVGFGCIFCIKWFYFEFVFEWLKYYILVRKFLFIVIVLELWVFFLKNCIVVLYFDNIVVVYVINKIILKDFNLM